MSNLKPVAYRNKFTGMIWNLEQQPGADKEPEIYEPLVLQSDVLGLVAENAIQDFIITAVKDLVRESEGVVGWHLNGDIASWDEVLPELSNSETPATDAAIAEIKAQGRAEGVIFTANRMLAAWESGFIDDTPAMALDISGAVLCALEFLPNAGEGEFKRDYADEVRSRIAANLRAGRKG